MECKLCKECIYNVFDLCSNEWTESIDYVSGKPIVLKCNHVRRNENLCGHEGIMFEQKQESDHVELGYAGQIQE